MKACFVPLLIAVINVLPEPVYSYIGKNFGDLAQTEPVNDFATLNGGISLSVDSWSFRPQLSINVTNIRDQTISN